MEFLGLRDYLSNSWEPLVVSGSPLETLRDPGSYRDLLESPWESFRVSKSPWVYLGVPRTYRDCIIFLSLGFFWSH